MWLCLRIDFLRTEQDDLFIVLGGRRVDRRVECDEPTSGSTRNHQNKAVAITMTPARVLEKVGLP